MPQHASSIRAFVVALCLAPPAPLSVATAQAQPASPARPTAAAGGRALAIEDSHSISGSWKQVHRMRNELRWLDRYLKQGKVS